MEIGDASSIEPIRKLLSNIEEALWSDHVSESLWFKLDGGLRIDISYWDWKDIPNRIYDLLETLIFGIGKPRLASTRAGTHLPRGAA